MSIKSAGAPSVWISLAWHVTLLGAPKAGTRNMDTDANTRAVAVRCKQDQSNRGRLTILRY